MNETSQTATCSRCGASVAPGALKGLCPRCLMALNLATQTDLAGVEDGPTGTRVTQPPPPPPSPEALAPLFPQLEILECLGRGGMGAVYKARQPKLDRFVALKILLPERHSDAQFAERFAREARALARLNHPAIVAVYDFGEAGGYSYLVMEYVDGLSLRQLLQRGKLAPAEALVVVPKICEALQFAHQQGIVHRDIKPENILLDTLGQVKIADFGIAKILAPGAQDLKLTGGRDVVGTPHYMAPEQVEYPAKVDHRADIYSLGVVFYEMLTGELPLGKFAPPSKRVQVDVRLDEVVLHALEKEPERRYQQASDVKIDVETIAKSGPGPRPTGGEPLPEPVLGWRDRWLWERHVIAFGFVPFAVLLLMMPVWLSLWGHAAYVVMPLATAGMSFTGLFAWLGHRIKQLKAARPRGQAEVAEGWLAWEQGLWPFNRSQGLAILHPDRLELVPVWYGGAMTIRLSDITSVRELRWVYVPLFWKHGFLLQLVNGERVGIAVPEPYGRRWRARLSQGKLPELPAPPEASWSKAPADTPEPSSSAKGLFHSVAIPLVVLREGRPVTNWPVVLVTGGLMALLLAGGMALAAAFSRPTVSALFVFWTMIAPAIALIPLWLWLEVRTCRRALTAGRSPPPLFAKRTTWWHRVVGALLLAIPVAVLVRMLALAPYSAMTDAAAPEIPRGSRFFVWKLARSFSPGDLIAYTSDERVNVGRVVRATNGAVQVNRTGQPDATITHKAIVGKVISVYWRAPAPPPPRVAAPQDTVGFGPTNAPGEYHVQLTNGVSVEVVALTSSPRTGMRWWRPDGTFLADPPGDRLGESSGLCLGGKSRVEFAVLLRNAGQSVPERELAVLFEPLPQTVAWTDLYKNNLLTGQVAVLGFHTTPATLACKVALVEGPWERVALWDHAGTLLHNESGSTLELQRSSADDETCLRLQHQVHPDQFSLRLAARLQNGEHRMARACRVDYAGVKAARLFALIRGLEATNVVAYELYRLPLSWTTISNIATKPEVPPMKP